MPEQLYFEAHLISPRWGTINAYTFSLERERMIIGRKADKHPVVCSWHEGENPIWSSHHVPSAGRHPLFSKLQEDLIHPPVIFARSLEAAWRAWRIGLLDDDQVQYEIAVLFEWVNIVAASRPRTDFWKKVI